MELYNDVSSHPFQYFLTPSLNCPPPKAKLTFIGNYRQAYNSLSIMAYLEPTTIYKDFVCLFSPVCMSFYLSTLNFICCLLGTVKWQNNGLQPSSVSILSIISKHSYSSFFLSHRSLLNSNRSRISFHCKTRPFFLTLLSNFKVDISF